MEKGKKRVKIVLRRRIDTLDYDIAIMSDKRNEYEELLNQYEIYHEYYKKYIPLSDFYNDTLIHSVKIREDGILYVLYSYCMDDPKICDMYLEAFILEKT